ncbi:MAG: O-antigen ligase family protein [Candidatus Doudnabacteria bacterium]|nr:O-antigen ligase family protein [Candidatus Doudnabacteria bacterium]
MKKFVQWMFFVLTAAALTASWWVFKDLLFPYVTSKAFFFRICVELALPFYVYLLLADKTLRPKLKNPLHIAVVLFFIVNVISSFTGTGLVRSLWGNFERMGGAFYLGHLTLLYFYVVALGQMPGNFFQRFLKTFLGICAVVSINGLFGWLHMPTLIMDPSLPGRVSSTLGNPIYLGSFAIIPMFISAFFAMQAESRGARIWYFVLAFLFFWSGYLSGTRGALVGFLAGSFIAAIAYLGLVKSKKIKLYGFGAVAVLVVVAGLLFSFSKQLPAGSTMQRLFTLKDSNTDARLLQWKVALKGYKDHPIFGVGPENYYSIANKYYDPEIYKYDRSWFDKPHNYWVEILVTNGAVGLAAYLAMVIFLIAALYKGYKAELYGAMEFAFMLAAVLAYQIQNLTVFDNVSSSLTFYVLLGFAGYIWTAATQEEDGGKDNKKNLLAYGKPLPTTAAVICLVVVAYVVYAANVLPMTAAKDVNYGFAYSSVDPKKGFEYFNEAASLPFNFDKTETASRYADFVSTAVRGEASKDQSLLDQMIQGSVNASLAAINDEPDYAITWQRLAMVYMLKGVQVGDKLVIDPKAVGAINKAVELAPNRPDPYITLAQIKVYNGDYAAAEQIMQKIVNTFSADPTLKMQASVVYRLENKLPEAIALYEQAKTQGYVFASYNDAKWVIDYYESQKLYSQALTVMQQVSANETSNVTYYARLAIIYAENGMYDQAKSLATQIIAADPTQKVPMQKLIDSLPK